MRTLAERFFDPQLGTSSAPRSVIDDAGQTPELLSIPDEEILKAVGLTAEKARELFAQPAESPRRPEHRRSDSHRKTPAA